jgi:ketosteroid isomerase-like protein
MDFSPALEWWGIPGVALFSLRDTARAMSQENVDVARQVAETFNRAYAEGSTDLYELLDPDVEWVPIKAILEGMTYHGHEGVRQWIEELKREWAAFEIRPEQFRDLGDNGVLALGTWGAQGRGGDVLLDVPQAAWLLQYRNGKVVRMQTFTERKKALEAAGLGE